MFMKKQNKKRGFTITELVVVISVIAILSAVLIPTFSGIINRSKMSADEQAVRNMNTVLSTVVEENPTYNDIADALDENGYNVMAKDSWNPSYKNYKAYWLKSENTIVLVKDGAVAYPESLKDYAFNANNELVLSPSNYLYTSTATTAEGAVADIKTAFENGNDVKLTQTVAAPIVIDQALLIKKDSEVTVDLGENTITAAQEGTMLGQPKSYYAFDVQKGGTLNITSGTLSSRGVMVRDGGTVVIGEDVEVVCVDANGGSAVRNKAGGTVIVEGATLKTTGGDWIDGDNEEVAGNDPATVWNEAGAKMVIKNCTIINKQSGAYAVSSEGDLEISGTIVDSYRGGICITGGTAKITNCTVTNKTSGAYALYVEAGVVTVSGNTFTNTNGGNATYVAVGATVNGL